MKTKRFAITLTLLLSVLVGGSVQANPGNDQGTKGTGSAGRSVVFPTP